LDRILLSLRDDDKYLKAKEKAKVSVMKENTKSAAEYLFKRRLHKISNF